MATSSTVYNEVTHQVTTSRGDVNGLDPMYHWDTHFPERLSKLHMNAEFASPVARRNRKDRRARNNARFKTQPITFDEIQEVDEDGNPQLAENKTMEGLKTQFTAFSRSMDGLVPSFKFNNQPIQPTQPPKPIERSSPIPKENQIQTTDPLQERLPMEAGTSGDSASDDARPETALIDLSNKQTMAMPMHLTDSARNRRQKRFKKKQRHNRSIEELPEVDRNNDEEVVR